VSDRRFALGAEFGRGGQISWRLREDTSAVAEATGVRWLLFIDGSGRMTAHPESIRGWLLEPDCFRMPAILQSEAEPQSFQEWLSAENRIAGTRMIKDRSAGGRGTETKGVESHAEGERVNSDD
jgi:hypothetical protein